MQKCLAGVLVENFDHSSSTLFHASLESCRMCAGFETVRGDYCIMRYTIQDEVYLSGSVPFLLNGDQGSGAKTIKRPRICNRLPVRSHVVPSITSPPENLKFDKKFPAVFRKDVLAAQA